MIVSVVIPVYNVERYLRQCVECVLSQSYHDLQVILVDDGSKDSSGDICDEYATIDARVQVIHKPNGGLSDARNAGLKVAQGDYVLFLDSDDEWGSIDFVEKLVQQAQTSQPDVILFELVSFTNENQQTQSHRIYENITPGLNAADTMLQLMQKNHFSMSACQKFIKTALLTENHAFFTKGLLGEDMDWIQRFWPCVQSVEFNNDVHYRYRVRSGSISRSFAIKNAEDFCSILETWRVYWEHSNDVAKNTYLSYLAYLYVTLIYKYYFISSSNRKRVSTRVYHLAELLQYSNTPKSNRLKLVYQLIGAKLMVVFVAGLQYIKKNGKR